MQKRIFVRKRYKHKPAENLGTKFLLFFLLSIFFGCATNPSEEEIENYKLKSEELIGQWLLKFSQNVSITCVQQNQPIDSLSAEEKNKILKKLNITEEFLTKQLKLSNHFKLTDSLVGNLKLVTTKKQKELEEQRKNGVPFWIWYEENCQGEWLNISRPIFNENYTLAYLEISTSCINYLCGTGGKSIYKLENGKWITIENFDNFIK